MIPTSGEKPDVGHPVVVGFVMCEAPGKENTSVAGSVIEVFDHGGLVCGAPAQALLG